MVHEALQHREMKASICPFAKQIWLLSFMNRLYCLVIYKRSSLPLGLIQVFICRQLLRSPDGHLEMSMSAHELRLPGIVDTISLVAFPLYLVGGANYMFALVYSNTMLSSFWPRNQVVANTHPRCLSGIYQLQVEMGQVVEQSLLIAEGLGSNPNLVTNVLQTQSV